MSGTTSYKQETISLRNALLAAISQDKDRAALGLSNQKRWRSMEAENAEYRRRKEELQTVINHMVSEYKNITDYIIKKKDSATSALNEAINRVSFIVPDAEVQGAKLAIKDKTARILNRYGEDINLIEGGACRTVLFVLIAYTLLKVQPDALPVIFLDETFATLSDETCATMRDILDILKEDILIVGIEQRNYLFDGLERTVFRVQKGSDKISTVRKEVG